jgi:hypothetical protein
MRRGAAGLRSTARNSAPEWGDQAQTMRFLAMQLLTWGTVVGAMGSALTLAVLNGEAFEDGKPLSLAAAGNWHAGPDDPAPLRMNEQRWPSVEAAQAASQPARR